MIRRLILSTMLGAGLLGGLALTPAAADAATPAARFGRHFEVRVRHGFHWSVYGVYPDRADANRAAARLRHDGFRVDVRRV